MIGRLAITVFLTVLFTSCAQKEAAPAASATRATVQMRDGTSISGTVLASSPSEIKLTGDDSITRSIPMTQVKSITYADALVTQAPSSPPPSAASSPAPAAAAPTAAEADPVHDQHAHPVERAVTTKTSVVAAGTNISVRNEETIDSGKAVDGQTFAAEVIKDVRDSEGDVVIPRGSNARIIIKSASKGGRFHGAADLVLDLDSVSIDGRRYHLDTVDLAQRGRDGVGANKRTAGFAGGGAAVGAIIGAIAGGGKGAAIGAGSGAGAGVATEIITKGGSVKVPVESVLTFRLERRLKVVAAR